MFNRLNLENLANEFRAAIEAAKQAGEMHVYIRKFPVGQCGNISDILAQYLLDCKFTSVIYINGTYYGENCDERWSHTWLEVDGLIVDLTADQFQFQKVPLKNNTAVYVGPMNDWYQLFDLEHGSYHKHIGLERNWSNYRDLAECYEIIKKYLKR